MDEGLGWEGDPRHAESYLRKLSEEFSSAPGVGEDDLEGESFDHRQRGASLGRWNSKLREVGTPGIKREDAEIAASEQQPYLEKGPAKAYRGLAALSNFMAQDAPDLGYAAKEISKDMSKPRLSDIPQLKRLGR